MKRPNGFFVLSSFVFISIFFVSGIVIAGGGSSKSLFKWKKKAAIKNIQFGQGDYRGNQNEPYDNQDGDMSRQMPATQSLRLDQTTMNASLQEGLSNSIASSSYVIYRTNYEAELEEDIAIIKGEVEFEIFSQGRTQIPLIRSDVGLVEVSLNRGSSYVRQFGNKYYLIVEKPGKYILNIEFLLKVKRERENGPGSFTFEVMPAPISQYEFFMPEIGVQIFVEPAIKVETKEVGKTTRTFSIMPSTNSITTRWTKALPKEEIASVKLEPKIYVDTATYASIGEGLVRCQSTLSYSILQSEVSSMRIQVPEDAGILSVAGRDIRDWKINNRDQVQYVDVYFNFGIKGNYVLSLTYERNIGEGSVTAEVPSIKTVGAEREKGYLGLAAFTNVELEANKLERVTAIDTNELPSSIWNKTSSPILLAFKYLNYPYSVIIDVTKHEELPVVVAAIDTVNYITAKTEDGKVLTKATYQVRNNVKQFLRIMPPKNAEIWSAFVSGKPVKPAKDKNGSVLVPLEKSKLQGQTLTRFPVEIVYLEKDKKINKIGSFKFSLPKVDIPISELNWFLYMPWDYRYFNFQGDVKRKEQRRRGGGFFANLAGRARGLQTRLRESADDIGEQYSFSTSQYEPYYASEKQIQEVAKEFKSVSMKGALPIEINVPTQGRLLRFSKVLVTEDERPWLSMNYIYMFKHSNKIIWLIVIGLLIYFVITIRKRRENKKGK